MRRRQRQRQINPLIARGMILAGLLLVFGLMLFRGRLRRASDDTYSDRRVLTGEAAAALSFGVYEDEDWEAFFADIPGEYLTVESLKQLLVHLDADGYIVLPQKKGSRAVTREEWLLVYDQILDLLDMERSVHREKVLLLDLLDGEQAVLVTNRGDYRTALPKSWFLPWEGYELYFCGDRCIGIAGACGEELSVDNAYLTECADGEVSFLFGGAAYRREAGAMEEEPQPGVCDLVFAEGELVSLRVKRDLISGELLSYDGEMIEIEGYGKVAHTGRIPVYQTYGGISEKAITDVVLGNMVVEYVTGGEEVCAILIRHPASIEDVRVLLLAEDGTNFRRGVYLACDVPATVTCGEERTSVPAGTVINAQERLAAQPGQTLVVTPESEEGEIVLCDAGGAAVSNGYAGSMEVRSCAEGYTVVNELPLELYLCAVVPSEMPSSYEPEAQKAQAVCARSYAYIQLLRSDLAAYGAHINDSTSYQVYNRIAPTPEAQAAVWETAGQILTYGGEPAEAYYFSTSMGYTDTAEIWNVEDPAAYGYLKSVCLNTAPFEGDLSDEETFAEYISGTAEGYDSDIKFYRWSASADYRDRAEEIGQILLQRHGVSPRNITFFAADGTEAGDVGADTVSGLGGLTGMAVTDRSAAGSALELTLQYENGSVRVRSEYNIRRILGCGVDQIVYADGSEGTEMTLLPSAFCAIFVQADGTATLRGGGYGHGLGMSQNAANGMAKAGMNYEEILQYFYNDIKIEHMQD